MRSVDAKMMSDAKIFLDRHQTKSMSPETIRRYMKTGRQFFGRHRAIQRTGAKATYYLRKAALEFYAAEQLMRAGRSGDLKTFRLAFLTLESLYTPLVGIAAIIAGNVCPIKQTQPINSKRKSLKGLPVDWRERMLVGESGQQREWLLLLSACGLRPSEIARGVDVIPWKNGAVFLIKGSKTSQGYGQKVREIYSESLWAKELAELGGRTISAPKANSVSKYVEPVATEFAVKHDGGAQAVAQFGNVALEGGKRNFQFGQDVFTGKSSPTAKQCFVAVEAVDFRHCQLLIAQSLAR